MCGIFGINISYGSSLSSTEAKKIFRPINDEKNALEAVDNQMELLLGVLDEPKGYLKVVTELEGDDDEEISEYQKWMIRLKCQYLYCALYHAKEMMPTVQNWDKCCQVAREKMLMTGIREGKCSMTIRNWYLDFTKKNRAFDVRVPKKTKLPPFLNEN